MDSPLRRFFGLLVQVPSTRLESEVERPSTYLEKHECGSPEEARLEYFEERRMMLLGCEMARDGWMRDALDKCRVVTWRWKEKATRVDERKREGWRPAISGETDAVPGCMITPLQQRVAPFPTHSPQCTIHSSAF